MDGSDKKTNNSLMNAISDSRFGSISRLSEHLGVHYRNVESYVIKERDPIDRYGYVKYDVAAMCEALERDVDALFPDECAGRDYKFDDGKHPGTYGPRKKKEAVPRYFPERCLNDEEARIVIDLLKTKALVAEKQVKPLAEELIRRLKPDEYEVFSRMAFEGASVAEIEDVLGIGSKAVRARYQNTLKFLNSPATMRILRSFSRGG